MTTERDQWIAARAYSLWEETGRLDGTHDDNWHTASAEYDTLDANRASTDGADILAKFRHTPRSVPAESPASQD